MTTIYIITDGSARLREIASYGYVIKTENGTIFDKGNGIICEGEDATNQYAELISIYQGLQAALDLTKLEFTSAVLINDSEISVRIANGGNTVKNHLKDGQRLITETIDDLEAAGKNVTIEWRKAEKPRSRAYNSQAHKLAEIARDELTQDNQRKLPWE